MNGTGENPVVKKNTPTPQFGFIRTENNTADTHSVSENGSIAK